MSDTTTYAETERAEAELQNADLQVIDRDVGGFGIEGLVQGLMPVVLREVGQSRDEVQAPGGWRGCVDRINRGVHFIQAVRPPTHL